MIGSFCRGRRGFPNTSPKIGLIAGTLLTQNGPQELLPFGPDLTAL